MRSGDLIPALRGQRERHKRSLEAGWLARLGGIFESQQETLPQQTQWRVMKEDI